MSSATNASDSTRPLQHLTEGELFTEVRARITDMVGQLEGLQLLRAFEAVAGIAG